MTNNTNKLIELKEKYKIRLAQVKKDRDESELRSFEYKAYSTIAHELSKIVQTLEIYTNEHMINICTIKIVFKDSVKQSVKKNIIDFIRCSCAAILQDENYDYSFTTDNDFAHMYSLIKPYCDLFDISVDYNF